MKRAVLSMVGRKTYLHCSGCDVVLAKFVARRRIQKINRKQPYYCPTCHPQRKVAT